MKYIKELILNLHCVFFISEKKSIYVDLRDEASLDLEDEKLLEEDNLGPQDSKGSRHHNKAVPWLKKTEYISTEFNRYGVSNDKTETKLWCVQIRSKQALSAFFDIGKETSSIMVYSFICKSVTFGGYKVSNSQSLWETIMLEKNNVVCCRTACKSYKSFKVS
ncbi:uncharacterized protein LOC143243177 isoform X3 [Tachypleus tridentatus]|uniref:uncharacterized protein LOC143243177 isoform X3 n=1 Tax=Tachypleus tridentatus TaxID=6853 RepID=UPI003FD12089